MPSKPAISGNAHVLPFEKLSPADFERLCYWIALRSGFKNCQHLGLSGGDQGRDIVAHDTEERLCVIQCKRVVRVSTHMLEQEMLKIRGLHSSEAPQVIIFAVSCAVSTGLRAKLRLAWTDFTIKYWDITHLDELVKSQPDILSEFFQLRQKPPPARCSYELYASKVRFFPDAREYRFQVERRLRNASAEVVTQDFHCLWCNRFRNNPELAEALYSQNSLRWRDICLQAWDSHGPLDVTLINSLGGRIDHTIHFRNGRHERFIYPGETRSFFYSYKVSSTLFGPYQERHMHLPVQVVRMEVVLPSALSPVCWGYMRSPNFAKQPIIPAVRSEPVSEGLSSFVWHSDSLVDGFTYGLEWQGNHQDLSAPEKR